MKGKSMNIALVLKVAGVGLVVAVAYQILQKSGRDELATYVSLAGVVIVMLLLVSEIDSLFRTIRRIFGI
jgi:stage III sporulation protein AC